jgi:hypothetical protein
VWLKTKPGKFFDACQMGNGRKKGRCAKRGVELTIRVHDGQDVKVVVVEHVGDEGVIGEGGLDDLVCHVLEGLVSTLCQHPHVLQRHYHTREERGGRAYRSDDPFTCVDGSVPDDGGLPRAVLAVEVDALNRAALERLASDIELRVALECEVQVLEEVVVLLEDVVRVEPGKVGKLVFARLPSLVLVLGCRSNVSAALS